MHNKGAKGMADNCRRHTRWMVPALLDQEPFNGYMRRPSIAGGFARCCKTGGGDKMEKYIALLRGINVGGKRPVPMAALKALFEGNGYAGVSTYVQSGNVIFCILEVLTLTCTPTGIPRRGPRFTVKGEPAPSGNPRRIALTGIRCSIYGAVKKQQRRVIFTAVY